ncbi:Hint domain-containing protein [Bordetella petrii]|uniref:Hint domain-containing protein n=1 Tax=Bordetella petrii TaxID=94624 RepID=UPI001E3E032D|nr:Hint domain-containing protein [Bordetella petrii]MCD0501741.1 Hint domain-containing protein [Bordetella petrii]
MATINLGIGNATQTVDQGTYEGDSLTVNVNLINSSTLNVTNTGGSTDVLEINQTLGLGIAGNHTINVGENASVELTGLAGVSALTTFNYNLAEGASMEMTPAFLNVGLLNTVNVNMDGDGSSTLIFDATGVNLDVSTPPNITGITEGDQIQVIGATGGSYVGDELVFTNDLGVVVGRFGAEGLDPALVTFEGGNMTYACYLKGTHIATPDGETKVEDLKAGDKVLTASGGVATVKWLGYRTLRKSRIPAKDAIRAFPVVIQKGAFAQNVPFRDLTLSPGHHVFFDGKLVPAMLLVNGKTITQDFARPVFEYFHVELESFDILLAEGVPAESYVDTGNRSMFQNAASVAMHPDFGPAEGRPQVEGIEVLRSGPVLEALRKHLLKRAETLTQSMRVQEPDLRVEVNGQEVRPETAGQLEGVMRFVLPAGVQASDLRILSRSSVVRDTTAHPRRDLRQVGVGLARITIEDEAGRRDIDLLDSGLAGLHPVQDVHGVAMRWTNGKAVIPAAVHGAQGQAVLELHVLRTYSYWAERKRAA